MNANSKRFPRSPNATRINSAYSRASHHTPRNLISSINKHRLASCVGETVTKQQPKWHKIMPMPLRNAAMSSRGSRTSKALEVFSIAAITLPNAHVAKEPAKR